MGRGRGRGGGRKSGNITRPGGKAGRSRDDTDQKAIHETFNSRPEANPAFDAYYKEQGFIPETEWDEFSAALRRELPTTFRVTGSRAHAEAINDHITTKFGPMLQNVILDGEAQPAPKQMEWYPGKLAWQLNVPKRTIRKSPEYKVFQQFLVGETEIGNISRQEAVSMIPPLLLNVEPHHICLDMCAAPGSKTAQLLEALNPHSTPSTGLLIANDADSKRCHLLVHQTGRMPSVGLGVTCNDASAFPALKSNEKRTRNLSFDRILADVPCSGDGTMRKNPDIWKSWSVGNGNQLHGIQLRILTRAMQLLNAGGRLVYSTCSFNPSENESVVASALNQFSGQFRIVPEPDALKGLKRRSGISNWKVASQETDGTMLWHSSYAHHIGFVDGYLGTRDASSDSLQEDSDYAAGVEAGKEKKSAGANFKAKRYPESVFPPSNAAELGLESCFRLLPHDQDTGGFFVCVLERVEKEAVTQNEDNAIASLKRAGSPSVPEGAETSKKPRLEIGPEVEESAMAETSTKTPGVPAPMKELKQGRSDPNFKEDPFFFASPEDPELVSCIEFFDLSKDFPRDRIFVRNGTGEISRAMYIANPILKSVIQGNDYSHAHMLSAGIKIFTRQDSRTNPTDTHCKWRIPNDGLSTMLPYLDQSKIVHGDVDDLRMLLEEQYPLILQNDTGLKASMRDREQGCHVVTFAPNDGKDGRGTLHLPITMPLWKGAGSLSLLIDKKEKGTLSNRTFGKDICGWTGLKKNERKTEMVLTEEAQEEEGVVANAPAIGQAEEAAQTEEDLLNSAA